MKISRKLVRYPIFTWVTLLISPVLAIAHSDENGWHDHMPGMWGWGWPLMIIFWVIGILIIVLLVVTITKILKK